MSLRQIVYLKHSKKFNRFLGDYRPSKMNLKLIAVIDCQHYNDKERILYMKLIII